jgi:hypothetical protein
MSHASRAADKIAAGKVKCSILRRHEAAEEYASKFNGPVSWGELRDLLAQAFKDGADWHQAQGPM